MSTKAIEAMRKLVMIFFIGCLPSVEMAQSHLGDGIDVFNQVADIFEKGAQPYFQRFAEIKFPPGDTSAARRQAIESQFRIYRDQATTLRKESLDFFAKDTNKERFNKDFLLRYFTTLYANNFPGLDYKFFEEVERQVKALKDNN